MFPTNSEKNDGALDNRYLGTHTDSSTLSQVWCVIQAVRADKSVCEGFLLRLSTLKWGYFMLLTHRESELCKQLPPSTSARSSDTEFSPSRSRDACRDNSRQSSVWALRMRAGPLGQAGPAGQSPLTGSRFPAQRSRRGLLPCLTVRGWVGVVATSVFPLQVGCFPAEVYSPQKMKRLSLSILIISAFICFPFFCCSFPGACIMTAAIRTVITISMSLNLSVLFMLLLQSSK